MTDDQWKRIQQIIRDFKPSEITSENWEALPPDPDSGSPELATPRQTNYLRFLKFKGTTAGLTKQKACKLIGDLLQGAS
jgi:hypothetical protein